MTERLMDLLDAWAENQLDAAGMAELNGALSDAESRRAAVRYIDQHFALQEMLGERQMERTAENIIAFPHGMKSVSRRARWQVPAAAAVVLAVCGAVSWHYWNSPTSKLAAKNPPQTARETQPPVACVASGENLLRADATNAAKIKPGDFLVIGRYRLESGNATLSLLSGVELFVQGATDFEIVSESSIFCNSGKLRAHVQAGAEGFEIKGPGVRVVDLGTEFGININPTGPAEVMVFEGKVNVSALDTKGATLNTQQLLKDAAVEVDTAAGQIRSARPDLGRFARRAPVTAPPLALGAKYPASVMKSAPWGYWRFEEIKAGKVANEIPAGAAFQVMGDVQLSPQPNRALIFGDADEQYLVLDSNWTLSRDYAIEFWFAPESVRKSTILSISRAGNSKGQYVLLENNAFPADKRNAPAAFRFLHRAVPGTVGGENIYSRSIVPYHWHHIVAQKREGSIELYVDGVFVSSESVSNADFSGQGRVALGRLWNSQTEDLKTLRPFVGRIDELAIYNHALDAGEIAGHFLAGNTSGK